MPIDIKTSDDRKGIEIICSGKMSGSEIIASQNTKTPDELENIRYYLIDYSQVLQSFISPEEIATIAANDKAMLSANPDMFIVAIVPNDIFSVLSNLWIAYADVNPEQIKHFKTREEAECWIGLKLSE